MRKKSVFKCNTQVTVNKKSDGAETGRTIKGKKRNDGVLRPALLPTSLSPTLLLPLPLDINIQNRRAKNDDDGEVNK